MFYLNHTNVFQHYCHISWLVDARIGFIGQRTLARVQSSVVDMYRWQPLREFVSFACGRTLYESTDPEGAVYVTHNARDYVTAWHFDQHPVSCALIIQQTEAGGPFEWVANLKSVRSHYCGLLRGFFPLHTRAMQGTEEEMWARINRTLPFLSPTYDASVPVPPSPDKIEQYSADEGTLVCFRGACKVAWDACR